ncbi:hypothetical protein ACWC19_36605, partial [Streptomyces sp. 900105245]
RRRKALRYRHRRSPRPGRGRGLSGRGRAFLADLRARREQELRKVLADMPAAKRVALLDGLEAFCAAAGTQIHRGTPESGSRTA